MTYSIEPFHFLFYVTLNLFILNLWVWMICFVLFIAIKAGGQTVAGQSTFYEVLQKIKAAIFSISRNNYSAMSSIGFPLWLRGKFVLFGHKNCNIKSCHIIPFWFNVDCFQNVILFAIHFEQAIGHFYSARFFIPILT